MIVNLTASEIQIIKNVFLNGLNDDNDLFFKINREKFELILSKLDKIPVEKVWYFYSAKGVNYDGSHFVERTNILEYSHEVDAFQLYREIYQLVESEEPDYKWTITSFNKL